VTELDEVNRGGYLSTSHSPKGRVENVAGGESELRFAQQRRTAAKLISRTQMLR
jgi:hypothetical protein